MLALHAGYLPANFRGERLPVNTSEEKLMIRIAKDRNKRCVMKCPGGRRPGLASFLRAGGGFIPWRGRFIMARMARVAHGVPGLVL